MIKIIKLCCSVLIIISLTSCIKIIGSDNEGEKKSNELLGYLESNNYEGLKNMFCEKIQSSKGFDEQVQLVLDFFEGEIISLDSIEILTNSGYSRENGNYTTFDIRPHITNIETNAEKIYEIWFSSWIVNTDYEDRVGISQLIIEDESGDECIIGDYYLVNP